MDKKEILKKMETYTERLKMYRRFVRSRYEGFLDSFDALADISGAGIIDVTDNVNDLVKEAEAFLSGLPPTMIEQEQPKQVEPEKLKPVVKYRIKKELIYTMGCVRWLNRLLLIHQDQKEFQRSQLSTWLRRLYEAGALTIKHRNNRSGIGLTEASSNAINYLVSSKVIAPRVQGIDHDKSYFIVDLPKLKRLVIGKHRVSTKQS